MSMRPNSHASCCAGCAARAAGGRVATPIGWVRANCIVIRRSSAVTKSLGQSDQLSAPSSPRSLWWTTTSRRRRNGISLADTTPNAASPEPLAHWSAFSSLAAASNAELVARTSSTSAAGGAVGAGIDLVVTLGHAAWILHRLLAMASAFEHSAQPVGVTGDVGEHVAHAPAGQPRRLAGLVVGEPVDDRTEPGVRRDDSVELPSQVAGQIGHDPNVPCAPSAFALCQDTTGLHGGRLGDCPDTARPALKGASRVVRRMCSSVPMTNGVGASLIQSSRLAGSVTLGVARRTSGPAVHADDRLPLGAITGAP